MADIRQTDSADIIWQNLSADGSVTIGDDVETDLLTVKLTSGSDPLGPNEYALVRLSWDAAIADGSRWSTAKDFLVAIVKGASSASGVAWAPIGAGDFTGFIGNGQNHAEGSVAFDVEFAHVRQGLGFYSDATNYLIWVFAIDTNGDFVASGYVNSANYVADWTIRNLRAEYVRLGPG